MSAASDLLYGRQGGRIVTKRGSNTHLDHAPRCELCGQPMVLGQTPRPPGLHGGNRAAAPPKAPTPNTPTSESTRH